MTEMEDLKSMIEPLQPIIVLAGAMMMDKDGMEGVKQLMSGVFGLIPMIPKTMPIMTPILEDLAENEDAKKGLVTLMSGIGLFVSALSGILKEDLGPVLGIEG